MRASRSAAPAAAPDHPDTWALLRLDSIYEPSAERDAAFVAAMRENTRWHFERNAPYRAFCESRRFNPDRHLTAIADLDSLPALAADAFKAFDLVTLRHVNFFTVSSSGTGGRRTTIPLDRETLTRMWTMGEATFDEEGLFSDEPVDYVILGPDPRTAPGHGNAQFFQALTDAAPARETFHALVPDAGAGDGGLRFDIDGAAARLARCATAQRPVRLLGLPALVARLAGWFARGPVRLPESSLVLTGGGWKADADAAVPKPGLRRSIERAWGLPHHRIRDLYGMTEHAVHYLECREHRFHAPVFARVRVVDPLTGRSMPDGEAGTLHLLNPGFTTMPFQSLTTADTGRMIGPCACGRGTPAFEVAGRGGTSRFRGCAATTLEAVSRSGRVSFASGSAAAPPAGTVPAASRSFLFGTWQSPPPLTGERVPELMRDARRRTIAARSIPDLEIDRVLSGLHRLWSRDGSYRAAFLDSQPHVPGGLSRPMIEWGLDRFAARLDPRAASQRVALQIGHVPAAAIRAEPLGVVLAVVSGNVFSGPAEALLAALLTGNVCIVKRPSTGGAFLDLFVDSLARAAPELAGATGLVGWTGGTEEIERPLAETVDAILVAADGQTIAAYRRLAPAATALIEFGPRVSVAVVSRAGAGDLDAAALARDVALWDQFACSAAQCVYVEGDDAAVAVAERLAGALGVMSSTWPEGAATLDERIETARLRHAASLAELAGDARVFAVDGGLGTVVFERDSAFRPSPLRRAVRVKSYAALPDLTAALRPARALMHTAGVAVAPAERAAYEACLAAAGARRICRIGAMNEPSLVGPHDGMFELQRLVRWVDCAG